MPCHGLSRRDSFSWVLWDSMCPLANEHTSLEYVTSTTSYATYHLSVGLKVYALKSVVKLFTLIWPSDCATNSPDGSW